MRIATGWCGSARRLPRRVPRFAAVRGWPE